MDDGAGAMPGYPERTAVGATRGDSSVESCGCYLWRFLSQILEPVVCLTRDETSEWRFSDHSTFSSSNVFHFSSTFELSSALRSQRLRDLVGLSTIIAR
jgi:hypothetical protein